MKIKLRANMRTKKRYLLIEGMEQEQLKKVILDYVGILGWAKANPLFVRSSGKRVVIAVNREEVNNLKASFALASENINVLRISGTLKGLGK